METPSLKTVPKISVKIWSPIIKSLKAKFEIACLRRDSYLGKILEIEIGLLDNEVSIPNSQESFDFVAERLDALPRDTVSLALPTKLIAQLNDVCRRKLIVRDAFFNRLFLLLAAAPKVIDSLIFGDRRDKWCDDVWEQYKHDKQFFQRGFYPLDPTIDPFWAIRDGLLSDADQAGLEEYVEPKSGRTIRVTRDFTNAAIPCDSLYTIVFEKSVNGQDLLGLSCYLPDSLIPGSDAQRKNQANLDELLGLLS